MITIDSQTLCPYVNIPPELLNTQVDTDLLVFVTIGYEPRQNYIAYAMPCVLSWIDNRPIIGHIHFNVPNIQINLSSFQKNLETTIHELIHILGFNAALFPYFKHQQYQANHDTQQHTVTKQIVRQGVVRNIVQTRKVRELAKKYFRCEEMEGLELENQGGTGSAGSHWERSILHNELMTASIMATQTILSEFTMALLEDTGWYKLNYSKAGTYTFAKNKGCSFLSNTCNDPNDQYVDEFCREGGYISCQNQRKVICNDRDRFADQCFYREPLQYCNQAVNQNRQSQNHILGESNAQTSYCFRSSSIRNGFSINNRDSNRLFFDLRCHLVMNCNEQQQSYEVEIGQERYQCQNQQIVKIGGTFKGELECQPFEQVCSEQSREKGYCLNECNYAGLCNRGKCECLQGFGGEYCEIVG